MGLKVINFFGAPGSGKTTAALGLAHYLKKMGHEAEYVSEFAKTQVWAQTSHLLSKQNWVFAHQEFSLSILEGKLEFAILDSPLLLSSFYAPENYPPCFDELCMYFFNSYQNINFFLKRDHEYEYLGRLQNEDEANDIEARLERFLEKRSIHYKPLLSSEAEPSYVMSLL